MVVLEFLGNIVTSILIGYLAFTNALAGQIEGFLPAEDESMIEAPREDGAEEPLEVVRTEKTVASQKGVPKILLKHAEFQKAALIASTREEDTPPVDPTVPISETITNALVNIYCQYKTADYIRTTTGTGFFINQKGIILTNAHVAQFLLLEGSKGVTKDIDCVIRAGNPATPKYEAELLYISPAWIYENVNVITDETPRGTGERDYALLYVSKSTDKSPLPAVFPSLAVDVALLSRGIAGASVMTAGYPAEALLRKGADAKLAPVVASTTIGNLYTFGSNYADIFSISESPVGEQGASGGPIVLPNDRSAIGLIVTKGDATTEGERSLRAITLSYVDRTILEETGFPLLENMQGDVAERGNIFKKAVVPFLAELLEKELESQ